MASSERDPKKPAPVHPAGAGLGHNTELLRNLEQTADAVADDNAGIFSTTVI
jgi:hypothetical protein